MKVWYDKKGKKWIDFKEFKSRFSEGVQEISPVQQAFITLMGQYLVLAGVIFGLVINFIMQTWWLFTILCGSLFVVSVATLGSYQKYTTLKKMFSPDVEEQILQMAPEILEELEKVEEKKDEI